MSPDREAAPYSKTPTVVLRYTSRVAGIFLILVSVFSTLLLGLEVPPPWSLGWGALEFPLAVLLAGASLFSLAGVFSRPRGLPRRAILVVFTVSLIALGLGLVGMGWSILNSPLVYGCTQGPCNPPPITGGQRQLATQILTIGAVLTIAAGSALLAMRFAHEKPDRGGSVPQLSTRCCKARLPSSPGSRTGKPD